MENSIVIDNNQILLEKYNITYSFKDEESLSFILSILLNKIDNQIVYLYKKVPFKKGDKFSIIKEDVFYREDGVSYIKIITNKKYVSLIKGLLRNFDYRKNNDSKKLILK